jgi:hypothetical protein
MNAEENIQSILVNKYWLSVKWSAWKYWKEEAIELWKINEWEWIYYKCKLENSKEIELDLWWRYDNNWNLDFTIVTLYPNY